MVQVFINIILCGSFILSPITHTYSQTFQDCIIENAIHLMGTPYKAGALDVNKTEQLTYVSDAFDCVTFVEYVCALSIYQVGYADWDKRIEDNIQKLRYRSGVIEGYMSRIHYFSEWIFQNTQFPFFKEISQDLGGQAYQKTINYMTKHTGNYPLLCSNEDKVKLQSVETFLSQQSYFYIPKNDVERIQNLLLDGDIVAMTTYTEGLDIVHTGFIRILNNQPFLLHASQTSGCIELSTLPLYDYLQKHKNQSGIRVLRPI